ncbi:putative monovalent cation:proton antiporter (CPA2 family) [uncultured Sphingopyxis sp.]|uniref:Putative monovalent cation:proton antiporter (CPA2 family) n=1 Tax=uncultured Sphingopyxis sp. TaxID=310581 RepID=A0A1Y5PY92_9SPHN|nr:YbaL family putative K(+) efflux transporter [uncultured Sphingopyxis sp.]SBV34971.1 putative monovalent cation:proton antiporter (CPA2 family) [uncultured Sphingopyxis sp.]
MPHDTTLIGTVVAGLGVAFLMGALAHRLKISPIAGYLLAGILVGPFTPGFVADTGLAMQLAEIGVILLMFGVGLHFSLKDLLAVRKIAVPGAIAQIAVATALGMMLGLGLGWPVEGSVVFGLALSVASTVVLLRALQARDMIETERGRIAVGWLIVEDLAMVLALVLLPAMFGDRGDEGGLGGGGAAVLRSAGIVLVKVVGFAAFMFLIARRVLPAVLHWVAHSGSRELFRLAVLAIALGVAFGAAVIFDVSFALGAFFAGMILGETQLSRRAAEETLPLRDAFAVLFFVSVGMLFNPEVLTEQPGPVIATVAIIVVGKSLAAFALVRAFGHKSQTALTISVSLAQIGEFSFILAGLGVGLKVLPETGRDLILAGSMLSILFNPILFTLAVKRIRSDEPLAEQPAEAAAETPEPCNAGVVLIGYGRVGSHIGGMICGRGEGLTVIEDQKDMAAAAEAAGATVIVGDATKESILRQAGLDAASTLLIAIPEGVEAGAIVRRARAINPRLVIVARAHSDEEVADLVRRGADHVVMAERETASRMAERAMLTRVS